MSLAPENRRGRLQRRSGNLTVIDDGPAISHNGDGSPDQRDVVALPDIRVEFNCGPMANSGVYLRGRYEVQIETNAAQEPPNRRMGAIYGFIAPKPSFPSRDHRRRSQYG